MKVAQPSQSSITNTICPGSEIIIDGQSFGQDTGQFFITLDNTAGCDSTIAINIQHHPQPQIQIAGQDSLDCGDTSILFVPTQPTWSFQWSTVDGSILGNTQQDELNINSAGTYQLIVTNEFGCSNSDSLTVWSDAPQINAIETDTIQCADDSTGSIRISSISGGSPPYLYSLDFGPFTSQKYFDELSGGTYQLRLKDSKDCITEQDVQIQENPPMQLIANGWPSSVVKKSEQF